MFKFLLKGILRDKHRSVFPIIIVSIGVMLTVVIQCWITGFMGDVIETNAKFSTGHVKIVSRAYAEMIHQSPNDLALTNTESIMRKIRREFPAVSWLQRIKFGGLLDVPDENGETKSQGPVMGLAIELFSRNSLEIERLNIEKALARGNIPRKPGEVLISEEFSRKLGVHPGDVATLISSSMYGSLVMQNFVVSGTLVFGVSVMDRGAMITDIADARIALDMQDSTGEILGFFKSGFYDSMEAGNIINRFNGMYSTSSGEFTPVMLDLKDQNQLAGMLDYVDYAKAIFIGVFVFAMSIVLWNAGIISGIRRYGEMGVRLAIGEEKGHVYRSLVYESILVGILGSCTGTLIGLGLSYLLQTIGFDVGSIMKNATVMMPTVLRARITAPAYIIGFLPGIFSTMLGTMLAGLNIYRRNTAQLFKELEA